MKLTSLISVAALLLFAPFADAETLAITGAKLINPGSGQVLDNAAILIQGDQIVTVGSGKEANVPPAQR